MTRVFWDSNDSKKLADLFRKGTKNSGVDPKRVDGKSIEDVRVEFFSDHVFDRFKSQSRRISREWCYEHDG